MVLKLRFQDNCYSEIQNKHAILLNVISFSFMRVMKKKQQRTRRLAFLGSVTPFFSFDNIKL